MDHIDEQLATISAESKLGLALTVFACATFLIAPLHAWSEPGIAAAAFTSIRLALHAREACKSR